MPETQIKTFKLDCSDALFDFPAQCVQNCLELRGLVGGLHNARKDSPRAEYYEKCIAVLSEIACKNNCQGWIGFSESAISSECGINRGVINGR